MTTNIDWNTIISTIKEEKCILLVGPEIFNEKNGTPIGEQLANYLDVANNENIQTYYQQDGLFLFTHGPKKTKSYYKIKSFHEQHFPLAANTFSQIAEIPFHLIISLNPDKLLYKVFQEKKTVAQFEFYQKQKYTKKNIAKPTKNNPLIYNLLGSIDEQESMVLTHDDLFDYFESIFKENSIPDKIQLNIQQAKNIIFLGLDFEKWYMQLLLRILHLHNVNYEFIRFAANQSISDELKTFCTEQFQIEFISKKTSQFIEALHERCEQEGILRTESTNEKSGIDKFLDWFAKDRIEDIFKNLQGYLENLGESGLELIDDLNLIMNKYNRLQRRVNRGILESEKAGIENNKIRESLLGLLNEAKTLA